MKVILKADVRGSGKAGDLINVSDGYAKNYLFPRKLAVLADKQALNELHGKEQAKQHRMDVEKQNAEAAAKKLSGVTVKVSAKAGKNGKLFGSVTSKEIAAEIKKQFGTDIDKRKIILSDEIKSFGTVQIEARLYPGVAVKLFVMVGEQA